jgi:undecaprenyl-diphosphatase
MVKRIRDFLDRVIGPFAGRVELAVLLSIIAVAICGFTFAELADDVMEGDAHAFDTAILLALRNAADPADPLGPRWLEELARDVTAFGGTGVLIFFTLATVYYLVLIEKRRHAVVVLVATASGWALSQALKMGFDRPRPDLVPHGAYVETASFPSGHAMMASLIYFTLAALIARAHPQIHAKSFVLSLALIIVVLVGISRVYLGVHWPTDVIAGWIIGPAWALLCWVIARQLQLRGQVEPEPGVGSGST